MCVTEETYLHTHALDFLFEMSQVIAVGNTEVVIWIIGLGNAVGRSGGADGEDGGGAAVRALGVVDFVDFNHVET